MKRFLLFAFAIIVLATSSFAQITVCETPCEAANPETDEFSSTIIQYNPAVIPEFTVGTPVDLCLTLLIPGSISEAGMTIVIDSIALRGFQNIPDGMSICVSDTMAHPNTSYTAHITGTPTVAGNFDLKIVARAYSASTQAFLLTMANNMLGQGYSSGITLVVNATGTELPVADFSASTTTATVNETISFTDESAFTPTSWLWDFGDGTTSTEQNPTHSYSAIGTYTVQLTVENENGSDTETKEDYITIEQGLICLSDACPIESENTFTETTIPYYTSQPMSYQVNTPIDLCLTIKCPESTSVEVNIYGNYSVNANANISNIDINGLSNLPEGLEYCLSGTYMESNEYQSIHIYGTPTEVGEFNINISGVINGTITSPISMQLNDREIPFASGIVLRITQDPSALYADFVASATRITEGETITFTNLSQNAGAYLWTFTGGNPITSTDENPSVTYSEAGMYSVTLKAAASTLELLTNAATETKENYIIVTASSGSDIDVDFEADQTTVQVGTTVNFTSHCSSNATAFSWTFDGGDPSTSTNANPSVTYNTPGVYDVSLRAGSSNILIYVNGVTETKRGYITVTEGPVEPPQPDDVVADFYVPTSLPAGQPITMQNRSQNATSWFWSFEGATPATSTEENPTITYTHTGTFAITLFVTNGTDSDTKTINVNVVDVASADFTADNRTINAGETVSFTNLSINASTFYWTFAGGEPSTSTDVNPTVTYNTPGSYSVTLFAAGENSSDTETKTAYITILPVTSADFEAVATEVFVGDTVSLINLSENATSFFWTFDGGTPENSTEQNPFVTYSEPGYYDVTLFATNGHGYDIATKTAYIYVKAITVADFTADTTTIQTGETVTFVNLSENATSYYWSFQGGEPATSQDENPVIRYTNAGVYNVTLFATNGASTDMKTIEGYITVIDGTSILTIEESDVEVYPNPAASEINVSADGMLHVSIFDLTGRLVLDTDTSSDHETFDVSKLQKSTYAIRITTNYGTIVRSLVIE
ncbi:MAG: PKD domain-containing protein [Bacteroidales bacterium]|nr:PKD domain-containing protein [Bacteroidales bacterium]